MDLQAILLAAAIVGAVGLFAGVLLSLASEKFKVKVNDRRVLREVLLSAGFMEDQLDSVCITFDKLSKIGPAGVEKELLEKEFDQGVIDRFMQMIENAPFTLEYVKTLCKNTEYIDTLSGIIDTSNALSEGKYSVEYDMTLVRGQGYYTGTVFEIESLEFGSSIAGGGRYDNLIGKFVKEQIPAVGFSIGFERIFSILSERGANYEDRPRKIVLLYEESEIGDAIHKAEELRDEYSVALFVKPKKLGKFLNRLEDQGYDGFMVYGRDEEVRFFSE